MTHHTRKARTRRSLTRRERQVIVETLRDSAKQQDDEAYASFFANLAGQLEHATIIIDAPAKRTTLREFQDRRPAPRFIRTGTELRAVCESATIEERRGLPLRGSDSLSDPRD